MSKVVLLKCEEYDLNVLTEKIKWGLDQLGGIKNIIPVSKKVLLKPNLVVAIEPEKAATTHPTVFEAVIKVLQEDNYNISFGDSPGHGNPKKVADKAGLLPIAEKYNVPLADFVNGEKISFLEGKACKQFDIANAILETDAIINLPKMKSHALQRITGAIKNPFGAVTGYNKAGMHGRFTNAFNFAEMIIDLNNYLKVDLHIMDGIVAMEGNGPRNGEPTKMNVILLSTDPVALDTVFCKLVDVDPLKIPLITYGQEYGLGSYEDIEIIGDNIESLINKSFDIPKEELRKEDGSKFDILKPFIRKPYIIKDMCKKCGICVEVCPLEEKALSFKNGKANPPKYDYTKCIRCYCCQEMCPFEAINVKTPFVGHILYGLGLLK